jgi:serine/threonine protein kinase
MGAQLVVVAGPDRGMVVPLTEGVALQLGRGDQADIALTDLYTSRLHCRVLLRANQLVVTDLGSAGGTYVNGEPVTERMIRAGEDVQIGETHFNLRLASPGNRDQATITPPMAEPVGPDEEPPPTEVPRAPNVFPGAAPVPKGPPKTRPPKVLPAERLTELTGETLAHYEIGPLLGRGQSGLVFRARDLQKDRIVALKVLWPEFTRDDAEIQRFVRSMKTAMSLRHPNLVSVFGAGKKGPYCYIAMDFVEGESLTGLLRRLGIANRLDWRHVFRVTVHLARALTFAHQRQIIHRNITPQNVLMRTADKATLLGDLFLAKAMEGGLATHLTRPGEVLGDVRYMAPERLEGLSHVDHRSDIFSLGALVYTMLTGQSPFEGDTLLDVLTKVRSREPEDAKKFQMSIPDSFNGVVRRMLAKRPESRYQETAKLLEELERLSKFVGVTV